MNSKLTLLFLLHVVVQSNGCWFGVTVVAPSRATYYDGINSPNVYVDTVNGSLPMYDGNGLRYGYLPSDSRVMFFNLPMFPDNSEEVGILFTSNFDVYSTIEDNSQTWRCIPAEKSGMTAQMLNSTAVTTLGFGEDWPLAVDVTDAVNTTLHQLSPPLSQLGWNPNARWIWANDTVTTGNMYCRVEFPQTRCPADYAENYLQCSSLGGMLVEQNMYCLRLMLHTRRPLDNVHRLYSWNMAQQDARATSNNADLGYIVSDDHQAAVKMLMKSHSVTRAWIGARRTRGFSGKPMHWKWNSGCCDNGRQDHALTQQGCYDFFPEEDLPLVEFSEGMGACRPFCGSSDVYAAWRSYNESHAQCMCLESINTTITAYRACHEVYEDFSMVTAVQMVTGGGAGVWGDFQPDLYGRNTPQITIFCGAMSAGDGKLYDEACATQFYFICEYPNSNPDTQCGTTDNVVFGNRCFRFVQTNMSWYGAVQYCLKGSGDLASLYDQASYDRISSWLPTVDTRSDSLVWVGVSRDYFTWSEDDSIVHYNNFVFDEPLEDKYECLYVDANEDYQWLPGSCTEFHVDAYFLGIRDTSAPPPPTTTPSPTTINTGVGGGGGGGGTTIPGGGGSGGGTTTRGPVGAQEDGGSGGKKNKTGLIVGVTVPIIVIVIAGIAGYIYLTRKTSSMPVSGAEGAAEGQQAEVTTGV